MVTTTMVNELVAELAALEDPKLPAVNERHGDDHGVNLGKLRAIAKRLKTQHELAVELWATDYTPARLLALLICRPMALAFEELDAMLREARAAKVQDWLVNYVVKKSPHAEALRLAWFDDADPPVASAGWALTSDRVRKQPEVLDLPVLLDTIEAEMQAAPDRLQWAMNEVPRAHRHRAPRSPRACDRYWRRPRGAQGLPDAAELHVPLRANLNRGDRAAAGCTVTAH